jgi:hypothetical protein
MSRESYFFFKGGLMSKGFFAAALAAVAVTASVLLLGSAAPAAADTTPQLGSLATFNMATLFFANDPILAEQASTPAATSAPANLPPGTKFKLFGAAKNDTDPENEFNEVFSFDTHDPNARAGAIKLFGDHVKVPMLDDQVELKYYYVGRTCGGGSTRFQLAVSLDGNNTSEGNAFGYVGDKPFGGGCPMNAWTYEDMTNNVAKWDLSQFAAFGSAAFCGNPMICTWQQVEAFFSSYPTHEVLNEVLVDDSQSFFVADQGCAYFDLVSAGARTYVRHDDANNSGDLPNNC